MIQIETLLGIKEVSEQLGINHFTIYKKIRENKFPQGVKYMGKRKFRLSDIEEYFTSLNIKSEVKP
jgi:excisionase family DNA binding protein